MQAEIVVLIPHYNNPDGLLESLKSIRESFSVDVLIVDDGSKTKYDKALLEENYQSGKLMFLESEVNGGITIALNKGLQKIRELGYEFIARLDCGDLFLENKLTKQFDYLKKNPEVKLLGTWVNFVNEKGERFYELKYPVGYKELRKKIFLNNMFVHPSVVFRTEVTTKIGDYPSQYPHAEDYAFFFNIIKEFKAENYPEILMDYIVEEKSISSQNRFQQVKSRIRIIKDNFKIGFYPIYGIIRNTVLLFVSRNSANKIKSLIDKKY